LDLSSLWGWLMGGGAQAAGGAAALKGLQLLISQPKDLEVCHGRQVREGRIGFPWAERSIVHLRDDGTVNFTPLP